MARINSADWKSHKAAQKTAAGLTNRGTLPERYSNVPGLDESGVYRKAAEAVAKERKVVASMLPRVALVCPAYCARKTLVVNEGATTIDVINAPLALEADGLTVRWTRDEELHQKITTAWLKEVARDEVLVLNGKYVYPRHLLVQSVEAYLVAITLGDIGIVLACALTFGSSKKFGIVGAVELVAMSRVDRVAGRIAQSAYAYMQAESRLASFDERIRVSGKTTNESQQKRRIGLVNDVSDTRVTFETDWSYLHNVTIDSDAVAYDVATGGNIALIAMESASTPDSLVPSPTVIDVASNPTIIEMNEGRASTQNQALALFNQAQRASAAVQPVKPVKPVKPARARK
jgi:hypothetical protein